MSATNPGQGIERILVALDASPQSLAALETAVELAARLKAELIGIFIEDINLVRIASLPLAREVGAYTASVRQLDSADVERHMRAQARWVQRTMALMAEPRGLHWSFRVSRGMISTELLAAAVDADLIILGRSGWSGRRGLGSTARVVVMQAPGRAMVLPRGLRLGLPVIVIYEDSEAGQKALAATDLVWVQGSLLTVILMADTVEEAHDLQAQAQAWLGVRDPEARYRWMSQVSAEILLRMAHSEGCGLLVLPAESDRLEAQTLVDLLNQTECAVMVVR